uniref:Neprosin PEP catalytic domain-containing protein n=1 Tax=Oryza punctata TaxID=4537 RepID=A0A0E0ME86_ORYPU
MAAAVVERKLLGMVVAVAMVMMMVAAGFATPAAALVPYGYGGLWDDRHLLDDPFRASVVSAVGGTASIVVPPVDPVEQLYRSNTTPKTGFAGSIATFDIYDFPNTKNGSQTSAQIWLQNDQNSEVDLIISGWESQDDGDWWLYFGNDISSRSAVGYWPNSLFKSLDHAMVVAWGGYTVSYQGDSSPPMGNGKWPEKGSASI